MSEPKKLEYSKIGLYSRSVFTWTLWFIPFYLPFVVWIASNFGSIYLLSGWKELVMAILLVILYKPLFGLFNCPSRVVRLLNTTILAYVLLNTLYIFQADSIFEFAAGALLGTRFLLFFLIAQVLAKRFYLKPQIILRIAVISGTVLSILALLQVFILPSNLLTHIGYEHIGQEIPGFPPALTSLGEASDYIRPQASLRGPNSLGAFLILPISGLFYRLFVEKKRSWKNIVTFIVINCALFLTFSRSAWLAVVVGIIAIGILGMQKQLKKYKLHLIVIVLAVFCISLVAISNKTVRLIIFREDRSTSISESDDIRASLTKTALRDIASHPLGYGPGKAGPVSTLEKVGEGKIAENYFLQVAQEVGWLGIGLFILIHILLIKILWKLRKNNLALIALASLLGLVVANLTLHTWSDEAVSILWWSLTGTVIGTIIIDEKNILGLKS